MLLKRQAIALSAVVGLCALTSAARAELIYGITDTGSLISFDSATPGAVTTVGALGGALAGHSVRAIDFRPANGLLYAVSADTATSTIGQLYTVNLSTAALTSVGAGVTFTGNTSTRISIDFNPVVDRLRVVTGTTQNFRIDPNTGALAGTDTSLVRDASNPNTGTLLMADVAYSNNVVGATSTTLYGYDYFNDFITTIGGVGGTPSPNGGLVFAVGSTGGVVAGSASLGFDISGATGVGYLNIDTIASVPLDNFYTVNLGTGALTLVGSTGVSVLDISVRPTVSSAAPEPASLALLVVGIGALALRRRRK